MRASSVFFVVLVTAFVGESFSGRGLPPGSFEPWEFVLFPRGAALLDELSSAVSRGRHLERLQVHLGERDVEFLEPVLAAQRRKQRCLEEDLLRDPEFGGVEVSMGDLVESSRLFPSRRRHRGCAAMVGVELARRWTHGSVLVVVEDDATVRRARERLPETRFRRVRTLKAAAAAKSSSQQQPQQRPRRQRRRRRQLVDDDDDDNDDEAKDKEVDLDDDELDEVADAPMSTSVALPVMPMGMPGTAAPAGSAGAAEQNPELGKLLRLWRAEASCPEVLPWAGELFEKFVAMSEKQEAMVDATLRDSEDAHDVLFVGPLYHVDLSRVRFALAAYARARLGKIIAQAGHVDRDRLGPAEARFLDRFNDLVAKHHEHALLRDLPPEATEDLVDIPAAASATPPMDAFVFVNVVADDLGDVPVGVTDHDTSELTKGDTYVLPYARVKDLVLDGQVELV